MKVNGIGLHYLDWGGEGEPLLFLTALGGTAGDFQALAVRLTDRFHVFGLTRRGQGESEKPATGYDTSTLIGDIKGFLDQQKIGRVILVGYSMAGNEMTEFATAYPRRTSKLVYLDAAYDLQENAELARKAQSNLHCLGRTAQRWSSSRAPMNTILITRESSRRHWAFLLPMTKLRSHQRGTMRRKQSC